MPVCKTDVTDIRLGVDIKLLRGGVGRGGGHGHPTRSGQRWLGSGASFQYVRLPVIEDRRLGGQALVSHERVANKHHVVLSPSNRR